MELLVLRWELAPEPATYCLANVDALPAAMHGRAVNGAMHVADIHATFCKLGGVACARRFRAAACGRGVVSVFGPPVGGAARAGAAGWFRRAVCRCRACGDGRERKALDDVGAVAAAFAAGSVVRGLARVCALGGRFWRVAVGRGRTRLGF